MGSLEQVMHGPSRVPDGTMNLVGRPAPGDGDLRVLRAQGVPARRRHGLARALTSTGDAELSTGARLPRPHGTGGFVHTARGVIHNGRRTAKMPMAWEEWAHERSRDADARPTIARGWARQQRESALAVLRRTTAERAPGPPGRRRRGGRVRGRARRRGPGAVGRAWWRPATSRSGTSSRSSRLAHGGLRYLEQREFALVHEALTERGLLLDRLAPHLVRPVPFLLPVTGGGASAPTSGPG